MFLPSPLRHPLTSVAAAAVTQLSAQPSPLMGAPMTAATTPADHTGRLASIQERAWGSDRHRPLAEPDRFPAELLSSPVELALRTTTSVSRNRSSPQHPVDDFRPPAQQPSLAQQPPGSVVPDQRLTCAARQEPELAAAINAARQQQGLPSLLPVPAETAERNCRYLTPLLRRMLNGGACDHDRETWQALVQEHGEGSALSPMSELILCPAAPPPKAAEVVRLWLQSPLHRALLLHRPRATAIDCLGMAQAGRTAAICTTWRGTGGPGT